MKSVVELDINQSRESVATLFADPANNPRWMTISPDMSRSTANPDCRAPRTAWCLRRAR